MKKALINLVLSSVKNIKIDFFRYIVLKPLFKLKGESLNSLQSFNNDRFFIYKVGNMFLPALSLHWPITYQKFEEWCDSTALYEYRVNAGDVVLDIGAGMGEEIIVLSKRAGHAGQVLAIEANPYVYNILDNVVNLNKLDNTKIFNLAISVSDDKVTFNDDLDSYLAGSVSDSKKAGPESSYEVQGCRLDTFFEQNNIQHVDLLKANIEGAERFVVDSISAKYISRIKRVAIACHDFRYEIDGNEFFKTKEYVSKFLVDNGFEIASRNTGESHIDDYIYGVNKAYAPQ
jgi:FkbM family methyltransferase